MGVGGGRGSPGGGTVTGSRTRILVLHQVGPVSSTPLFNTFNTLTLIYLVTFIMCSFILSLGSRVL